MMRLAAIWMMVAALVAGCTPAVHAPPAGPAATVADDFPFHRGVNVLGYDPYWKDPSRARFQWRHFAEIRRAGFDHVRVNLFAFDHMDSAHRLDPRWLQRLDAVVREARAAGLGVILDEHDFNACAKDVPTCRVKLAAFWGQVAPRYRDAPRNVAFELLNEPHEALDAPTWNAFLLDLMAVVRQTNPDRIIVVGPTRWNNFAELPTLELPEQDRNLLVTFHYYDPFHFTHQGTSWTNLQEMKGVTWGSEADKAKIRADFDQVAAWAAEHRRPILLGEFGAYDKSGTPLDMRMAWIETVVREAERRGFGWAYWQFDSDFVVWDMARDSWVEPVLRALFPSRD